MEIRTAKRITKNNDNYGSQLGREVLFEWNHPTAVWICSLMIEEYIKVFSFIMILD